MANPSQRSTTTAAFAVDLAIVVGFVLFGRASHGISLTADLWTTLWPFLGGLLVAWMVSTAWRKPTAPWRTGLPVALVTVLVGMLLRSTSDQGTAPVFILVTAGLMIALMVGWRMLIMLVRRTSHRGLPHQP